MWIEDCKNCGSELMYAKCIQNVCMKIYPTFQQTFIYILYKKFSWHSSFNFVYKSYTKVCQNVVCILHIYILYIYILCTSCIIFAYKMYTQFSCGWWNLPIIWKTRLLKTLRRVQLCKKVQVHNFLKPPLEYNQDQMPLTNQGSLWPS